MDSSVRIFLERKDPLTKRLTETVGVYLDESERDGDWVFYTLCSDLLSLSPLKISSSQHVSFWRILESVYNSLGTDWGYDAGEIRGRFIVLVNNSERTLSIGYQQALWVLLRTLVDHRLSAQMLSVQEIPHQLAIAFLRHRGLREFMVKRVWTNVQDSLDVSKLFHSRQITQKTMQDLLDLENPLFDDGRYETPIGQHGDYGQDDSPQSDGPKPLPELPLRKGINASRPRFCSQKQLHLLCMAYRLLRLKLDAVLENCTLPNQLLQVELLFSILHMNINQTMENQSSCLRSLHTFYKSQSFSKFIQAMDATTADLIKFMKGQTPSPELLEVHNDTQQMASELAYSFHQEFPTLHQSPFDSNNNNNTTARDPAICWLADPCTELSLETFFSLLETQACLFYPMLKAKAFLHKRERGDFLAYRLTLYDTSSLAQLEHSLSLVNSKCLSLESNPLTDLFSIKACSRVFVICRPQAMYTLRMVMLVEALETRDKVCNGDFALNIIIRALLAEQVNTWQHRFMLFTLINALALFLGGRKLQQLVARSDNKEAYEHYQTVFTFISYLKDLSKCSSRRALACFVAFHASQVQFSAETIKELEHVEDLLSQDLLIVRDIISCGRKSSRHTAVDPDAYINSTAAAKNASDGPVVVRMATKANRGMNHRFYRAVMHESKSMITSTTVCLLEGMTLAGNITIKKTKRLGPPLREANCPRDQDNLVSLVKKNSQLMTEHRENMVFPSTLNIGVETRRQMAIRGSLYTSLAQPLPSTKVLSELLQVELNYRGGAEGSNQLYSLDRFVEHNRLVKKLRVHGSAEVDFEDSIFLAFNSSTWNCGFTTDTLCGTPVQTVINVDTIRELALQYGEEWEPGDLLAGTESADSYSNFLEKALCNEVLDA